MPKLPKVRKESGKREREEGRTSEEGTNPFRTGRSPSRSEEGNKSKEMETMIREIREDMAGIREEMRGREEKWQAEEADWWKRMKMIEEKIEQREKKGRKNNLIITGIGGIRGNIERNCLFLFFLNYCFILRENVIRNRKACRAKKNILHVIFPKF
jgi:hypothetical protein